MGGKNPALRKRWSILNGKRVAEWYNGYWAWKVTSNRPYFMCSERSKPHGVRQKEDGKVEWQTWLELITWEGILPTIQNPLIIYKVCIAQDRPQPAFQMSKWYRYSKIYAWVSRCSKACKFMSSWWSDMLCKIGCFNHPKQIPVGTTKDIYVNIISYHIIYHWIFIYNIIYIYMGMALKTLWIVPRWSARLERGDYVKGNDPEVSKTPNDMTWNVYVSLWPRDLE